MTRQQSLKNRVLLKIVPKLLKSRLATFFLDPLIPRIIKYYFSVNLKKWKSKGTIQNYTIQVHRISKLNYDISMHMDANKEKTQKAIVDLIAQTLESTLTG